MKEKVLGTTYDLSLVIISDATAKKLTKSYRGYDKRSNVLSFPLSKTEGEMTLNLAQAKLEAPTFGLSYRECVAYLFIHGLFHLKGLDHGRTMKTQEIRTLRAFGFSKIPNVE